MGNYDPVMRIGDPYVIIANMIIARAVEDYRNALQGKNCDDWSAAYIKVDCERFFRSSWFKVLTKLDGNFLIEKLKQEAESK